MYKQTVSMLGVAVVFLLALPANGASLYFNKVSVHTQSEATCFKFASDTARAENLRNVHQNRLEVAGEKDNAYVSITCVGRNGEPAMAVVMSVSDDLAAAKAAADAVANRIKGIICFEGC